MAGAKIVGKQRGFPRLATGTTAEASGDLRAVEYFRLGTEMDGLGAQKNTAEIFAVIIEAQPFIPCANAFHQAARREPRDWRHHAASGEVVAEPRDRIALSPVDFRLELNLRGISVETAPGGRRNRFGIVSQNDELPSNLFGPQQIIGV